MALSTLTVAKKGLISYWKSSVLTPLYSADDDWLEWYIEGCQCCHGNRDLGWKRGEIPKKIKDRIILCSDLRGVAQTKDNCRKKG